MAATATHDGEWNPYDKPVDYVLVAGKRTPGLAEVLGADTPRRWDEREAYGLAGALVVYHGVKLSHFRIVLRLLTPQDWLDWHKFRPLVAKAPIGQRQRALDVQHPLLDEVGIRSAVVENMHSPEQTGDGEWTITLDMIEYRTPKVALAKPDGAAATPVDPYDAIIDQQSKQIDDLSGVP